MVNLWLRSNCVSPGSPWARGHTKTIRMIPNLKEGSRMMEGYTIGEYPESRKKFAEQIRQIQEDIGDIPLDGEMEINGQIIKYPTKNNVVRIVKSKLLLTDLDISSVGLKLHHIDVGKYKDRYGADHTGGIVIVEETFQVTDVVSGYSETYTWLGQAKGNDKAVTIASSYSIRDFYIHFFNITVDGDASYENADLIMQATNKLNKEELTQIFYEKALRFANRATMAKVQKEAKRKGIKFNTWEMTEMGLEDLLAIIDIAIGILNPDKAISDMEKMGGSS